MRPVKHKKRKNFTLIELLVVVAIITLLSTMVLVSFRDTRARARDAQRKTELGNIQKALEMYYAKEGHYPFSNVDVLVPKKEWECGISSTPGACPRACFSYSQMENFLQDLVGEGFFSVMPKDPFHDPFFNLAFLYGNWSYIYANVSTPYTDRNDGSCIVSDQQYFLMTVLERSRKASGDRECFVTIANDGHTIWPPMPFCLYILTNNGLLLTD